MSRTDLVFVCLGNICRSTMAEQVARARTRLAGLQLGIGSAGISDEEHGNPIDPRAARCLRADVGPGRGGTDVPDPWLGGPAGFESTLEVIEAAMPALLDEAVPR